ncbi:hypothetical protein IMCC21906_00065 [Spongiibacter sp. IMCC21906]|uniref:DUF2149 domain-containing protein n=1 Tax=Spongiibacter sp. IMCC21906 TaxID=1620392 RepID=UPI00062DFC7E|nr:DUF2149 domain-containing protein [Spongiibacter sp. IMCC21906]AKH67760.1 hypothetical protein IMCC21906_00065 [Spongiibacter sp. IMCC21906]
MDKWRRSAFLDTDEDPLGPMANLVDIILVFACGLIAALVSFSPDLQKHFSTEKTPQNVSLGKELSEAPESLQRHVDDGSGYEALGKVYRDPKTGKLVLIGE